MSAFLPLWVCSLGKPWAWGLGCFAVCLSSQKHTLFSALTHHLRVGNTISPPSCSLTFTSTEPTTSNWKSVPSHPFFCLISTYFAYCFENNYRLLISKSHCPFRKPIWTGMSVKSHRACYCIKDSSLTFIPMLVQCGHFYHSVSLSSVPCFVSMKPRSVYILGPWEGFASENRAF